MPNSQRGLFFCCSNSGNANPQSDSGGKMSPAIFCRSAPAAVDKNPLYEASACRRKIHSVYLQKGQSYSIRKPSEYYYLEEASCCCVRAATSQVIPVLLFVRSPGESHCYEGQYKNQSEETGASLFRFMQLEHCNLGICCV